MIAKEDIEKIPEIIEEFKSHLSEFKVLKSKDKSDGSLLVQLIKTFEIEDRELQINKVFCDKGMFNRVPPGVTIKIFYSNFKTDFVISRRYYSNTEQFRLLDSVFFNEKSDVKYFKKYI